MSFYQLGPEISAIMDIAVGKFVYPNKDEVRCDEMYQQNLFVALNKLSDASDWRLLLWKTTALLSEYSASKQLDFMTHCLNLLLFSANYQTNLNEIPKSVPKLLDDPSDLLLFGLFTLFIPEEEHISYRVTQERESFLIRLSTLVLKDKDVQTVGKLVMQFKSMRLLIFIADACSSRCDLPAIPEYLDIIKNHKVFERPFLADETCQWLDNNQFSKIDLDDSEHAKMLKSAVIDLCSEDSLKSVLDEIDEGLKKMSTEQMYWFAYASRSALQNFKSMDYLTKLPGPQDTFFEKSPRKYMKFGLALLLSCPKVKLKRKGMLNRQLLIEQLNYRFFCQNDELSESLRRPYAADARVFMHLASDLLDSELKKMRT